MNINSDIIAKLEKLLRLAGNKGATQAEMETAMRKAQELAVEHNIDLSTIDAHGNVKVGGIDVVQNSTKTKTEQERPYHFPVIQTLEECFGVKVILSTHYNHQSMRIIDRITFVGERMDVQMALFCFGFLENLFPKCWLEYRKANNLQDKYPVSRSFYVGLSAGIRFVNKQVRETQTQDNFNRYQMVLVNKDALVKAKFNEFFPKQGSIGVKRNSHDKAAEVAGYVRGTQVKLNPALT